MVTITVTVEVVLANGETLTELATVRKGDRTLLEPGLFHFWMLSPFGRVVIFGEKGVRGGVVEVDERELGPRM